MITGARAMAATASTGWTTMGTPSTEPKPLSSCSPVAEQANADDDVARKGQTLLRFQVLFLEAGAAEKGYDGVFADHETSRLLLLFKRICLIIDIAEKAIIEKPVRSRLDMLYLVAFKPSGQRAN